MRYMEQEKRSHNKFHQQTHLTGAGDGAELGLRVGANVVGLLDGEEVIGLGVVGRMLGGDVTGARVVGFCVGRGGVGAWEG